MDHNEYLKKNPNKILMIRRNKTIEKVWGEEHILAHIEGAVGKLMILKKNFSSSAHSHRIKKESFHILKGKILFCKIDLDTGEKHCAIMNPGDIVDVAPNEPHQFVGLEDSEFIETSYSRDGSDGSHDNYRFSKSQELSDEEILVLMENEC